MNKSILILIFLISFSLQAQQEVNFRRVTNSTIIEADTILSNHSSDIEAIQQLLNYQSAGRSVRMIGSTYQVDIKNQAITDTIYIGDDWSGLTNMKVIDSIEILAFNYGSIRSDSSAVLNNYGKIIQAKKDSLISVPFYSFTAKLERTKSWPDAGTSYKLVDIPFFFCKSDSIVADQGSIFKYRTFANRSHCIRYELNGERLIGGDDHETRSCNPGNSEYAGGSFRHSNTITDLDRSKDNILKFEAIDQATGKILGTRTIIIPKI